MLLQEILDNHLTSYHQEFPTWQDAIKGCGPVAFDDNDREKDARLFFTLAAVNHDQHLNNMMQLSELLMNEEVVNDLLEIHNDDDLRKVIEKYK